MSSSSSSATPRHHHPLRHSPLYPSDEFEIEASYNHNVISNEQNHFCKNLPTPTSPAILPSSTFVLEGKHVRLTPLDFDKHAPSIYHHLGAEDGVVWDVKDNQNDEDNTKNKRSMNWLVQTKGPYRSYEDFVSAYKSLMQTPIDDTNSPHHLFFRHQFYAWEKKGNSDEDSPFPFVGTGALFRCDQKSRVIEIGHLAFCPAHLQGTTASTESFFLLLRHCFNDLGYRRVEWKTNSQNEKSRQAALRLGFNFEGVFRQLMTYERESVNNNNNDETLDTRNRDTAWYAMYDCDWFGFLEEGYKSYLKQFDDENSDETSSSSTKKRLMECLIESQKQSKEK